MEEGLELHCQRGWPQAEADIFFSLTVLMSKQIPTQLPCHFSSNHQIGLNYSRIIVCVCVVGVWGWREGGGSHTQYSEERGL